MTLDAAYGFLKSGNSCFKSEPLILPYETVIYMTYCI